MERRMSDDNVTVETRADGSKVATGYAAVFYREGDTGSEFKLGKDFVERIAPTAFARAISEQHDVRALFNHDPNHILGRTKAGTLSLSTDAHGLRYSVDLPNTQAGRDVAESISRGDVTGSSFGFVVKKQNYEKNSAGHDVRNIQDLDLLDVSPVVYPAYTSTSAAMRAGDAADAFTDLEKWRAEQQAEAVAVRMRVLDIDNATEV